MLTVAVRGLPRSTTERGLKNMFSEYGRVHQLKLARDIFSGDCRGMAEVKMEGHEAREAADALDGRHFDGSHIKVQVKRRKPNKRFR